MVRVVAVISVHEPREATLDWESKGEATFMRENPPQFPKQLKRGINVLKDVAGEDSLEGSITEWQGIVEVSETYSQAVSAAPGETWVRAIDAHRPSRQAVEVMADTTPDIQATSVPEVRLNDRECTPDRHVGNEVTVLGEGIFQLMAHLVRDAHG